MLTSGDVVDLELGSQRGREAGLRRPVVVVTAQEILDESANVVQVVPLTSIVRPFGSVVQIQAAENNGLEADAAAQCQHIRSVSVDRVESVRGNVGAATLAEIRDVLGLLLDVHLHPADARLDLGHIEIGPAEPPFSRSHARSAPPWHSGRTHRLGSPGLAVR